MRERPREFSALAAETGPLPGRPGAHGCFPCAQSPRPRAARIAHNVGGSWQHRGGRIVPGIGHGAIQLPSGPRSQELSSVEASSVRVLFGRCPHLRCPVHGGGREAGEGDMGAPPSLELGQLQAAGFWAGGCVPTPKPLSPLQSTITPPHPNPSPVMLHSSLLIKIDFILL